MSGDRYRFEPELYHQEPLSKELKDKFLFDIAAIRSLYDAGEQLFSRESLRQITNQLENVTGLDGKVVVQGMNHQAVQLDIHTGMICPGDDPTQELVVYDMVL